MSRRSVDSDDLSTATEFKNTEPTSDCPSSQYIMSTIETFDDLKQLVHDLCDEFDSLEAKLRTMEKEVRAIGSRLDDQAPIFMSKPSPLEQDFPLNREGYEDWSEKLGRTMSNHDGWFKNENRKLDYLIESAKGWLRLFLQDRYGYRRRQKKARRGRSLSFKDALNDMDEIFLPPKGRALSAADDEFHFLRLKLGQSFSAFLPKFLFYSNRAGCRNHSQEVESLFNRLPEVWQTMLEIKPFGSKKLPATLQDLVHRVFEIEAWGKEGEWVASTSNAEEREATVGQTRTSQATTD